MTDDPAGAAANTAREVIQLDHGEAMRLLASVGHGRVVFTRDALPAIRPVNHLVDDGQVILRTRLTSTISTAVRSITNPGVVVAYEADDLDPQRRTGWSVVVTGLATTITDPGQIARYEKLLHPWVNMAMDTVIADQSRDRHRHPHRRRRHAIDKRVAITAANSPAAQRDPRQLRERRVPAHQSRGTRDIRG